MTHCLARRKHLHLPQATDTILVRPAADAPARVREAFAFFFVLSLFMSDALFKRLVAAGCSVLDILAALSRKRTVRELIEQLAKILANTHLLQPGCLDGDLSIGCKDMLCSRWAVEGSTPVSRLREAIIRVRRHTSASSGAGSMEQVSTASKCGWEGLLLLLLDPVTCHPFTKAFRCCPLQL